MRSSRTTFPIITSEATIPLRSEAAGVPPTPVLVPATTPSTALPTDEGGANPPPQAPVVHEVVNPPPQVRSPVRPNNVRDLEPGLPLRTGDHIIELRADGDVAVTSASGLAGGDRERADLLKPGATAVAVLGDLTVVFIRTPTVTAVDEVSNAESPDPRAADLAGYDASTPTPAADPGGSEVDDGQG